ncbi:MAG: MerR family transcriptional regulator [Actinomycetota bacterium]|nr:MerR family transcriptional regulator [Actinomycetota bacterium]
MPDTGLSAGDVARRLGIAVSTLRSWDRRYGLGPSVRDPGRHRRYHQRDVYRLTLMRQLTIDGVAAAEAARIARELRDPSAAAEIVPGAEETAPAGAHIARSLRRAAVALDPGVLDRLIHTALTQGVVQAWTTAFAPALREVGDRYTTISRYIAAEHLLSAAISAALAAVPRPDSRPSIMLACAPAEDHTLPLEALAAALAERGRASRMFGARLPADVLRDAIIRTGPTAVVIWAHTAGAADPGPLAAAVNARPRPSLVAACGPGWRTQDLPAGVRMLTDLAEAVTMIAELP